MNNIEKQNNENGYKIKQVKIANVITVILVLNVTNE